jgi:hypothetical protein
VANPKALSKAELEFEEKRIGLGFPGYGIGRDILASLLAEVEIARAMLDAYSEDPDHHDDRWREYRCWVDGEAFLKGEGKPDAVAAFKALADAGGREAYKDVDAQAFVDELRGYARHLPDCPRFTETLYAGVPVATCTCGLDEILKGEVNGNGG